jgi:two-component system sensor histidine kinase RegB
MQELPIRTQDPLPTISLRRLIGLRWFSVLSMIVAAVAGQWFTGSALFVAPLLAVAAVMASVNVCLQLALLFDPKGFVRISLFSPLVQLGFDLVGWGAFVYYSGGAGNPLISVFLPLAAVGAMILPPWHAWFFGFASVTTYSFLWFRYVPLDVPDVHVAYQLNRVGMWTVFVVSALVVVWFVSRMMQAIRHRDAALSAAREAHMRNRWLVFLGTLAASTAHQMSTPLGTLQILIDDLLLEHRSDGRLRADLELMRTQVATCKGSLTELTARAGQGRSESRQTMPFDQWMQGLVAGWQSTHPTINVALNLDSQLAHVQLYPDSGLEAAIQGLLESLRHTETPGLSICAKTEDDRVVLELDETGKTPLATTDLAPQYTYDSSDADAGIQHDVARTAIELLGGDLLVLNRPDHSTTISIHLPKAALLWT